MSNDNTPSSRNIDVETVIRQSNLIVDEIRKPETAKSGWLESITIFVSSKSAGIELVMKAWDDNVILHPYGVSQAHL